MIVEVTKCVINYMIPFFRVDTVLMTEISLIGLESQQQGR
jgi:hypothetical protein